MNAADTFHLEYFFEISVDLLCIAGLDGYFKRVNPAFTKTLGYSARELLDRPFLEFVHPEDQEKTRRELARLAEGVDIVSFENRYRCKDGSWVWLGWTCPAAGREDTLLYAVARDITREREQWEQLARLAYNDSLTGLANRRTFGEAAGRALSRARRSAGRVAAILYLDIDGFKKINDRHGHHTGDLVLQSLASIISSSVREDDVVGRMGGDEMAVLLQGRDIDPEALAFRVLDRLSRPLELDGTSIHISASLGISISNGQDEVDSLIHGADSAMCVAKKDGGGCLRSSEPSRP